MDKYATFKDIVNLMENDYAGYQDKHVSSELYLKQIHNEMNNADFEDIVWDYVRSFQDGHVNSIFYDMEQFTVGFTVRRDDDGLYITTNNQEKDVKIGDEIVKLDGEFVEDVAKKYANQLDDVKERQNWEWIIERYQTMTLQNGKTIELKHYDVSEVLTKEFRLLNDKIGILTLQDFADPKVLNDLLEDNQHELDNIDYLIVDIRVNYGGTNETYYELLNYFVDKPQNISDAYPVGYGYTTHWTQRNKENWLNTLTSIKEQYPDNNYYDQFIDDNIKQWENPESAKTVDVKTKNLENQVILNGRGKLKHVYVLIDVTSISAADEFALLSKSFDKVTVVGRNTLGIVDYNKIARQYYDNLVFLYPTTRQNLIDEGQGLMGIGVEPDVLIPWSHESIGHDEDMEWVLNNIQKNQL